MIKKFIIFFILFCGIIGGLIFGLSYFSNIELDNKTKNADVVKLEENNTKKDDAEIDLNDNQEEGQDYNKIDDIKLNKEQPTEDIKEEGQVQNNFPEKKDEVEKTDSNIQEDLNKSVEPILTKPTSPQPVAQKPQPTVTSPQPVAQKPQPTVTSPQPVAQKPQPTITSPQPTNNTQYNSQNSLGGLGSGKIIELTNAYRSKRGLYQLRYNNLLSISAGQKVDLIFQEQYFEHVGKNGITMKDLATGVGYEILSIGENLAYGNYSTEQQILDSWIKSPGHHALLISPKFIDIGVSVKKGIFNGQEVWVAVQHFGRPLSLCADLLPSSDIKSKIDLSKQRLQYLSNAVEEKGDRLSSFKIPSGPEYLALIEEYNNIVAEHNQTLEGLRSYINIYNQQIEEYNECVAR